MIPLGSNVLYELHKDLRKLSHRFLGHLFDPQRDIVLVTGGCAGLGREIVAQFVEKGARVVVLDLQEPTAESRVDTACYFRCNVSEPAELAAVCEQIRLQIGVVTVLVNNAGVARGKTVLELEIAELEQTIKTNLLLSFYTAKVFLPGMLELKRGYVVTVGSVLGYMSPARLSAYGASKAGLVAFHESLTYELGPPLVSPHGVKTLLLCPGQMRTELFRGVKTPLPLLAPELEPRCVARALVTALELGRRGEIKLPFYGNFLPVFRAVPWPITEAARYFLGIDASVRTFREAVSRIVSREASTHALEQNLLNQVSPQCVQTA